MNKDIAAGVQETIGLDLGDRVSTFCRLDGTGEVVERGEIRTEAKAMKTVLGKWSSAMVAIFSWAWAGLMSRKRASSSRSCNTQAVKLVFSPAKRR